MYQYLINQWKKVTIKWTTGCKVYFIGTVDSIFQWFQSEWVQNNNLFLLKRIILHSPFSNDGDIWLTFPLYMYMTIFPTTKSFLKNFMKHQIHHLRLMSPTFCLKAKTTSDPAPPPPSPSIQSLLTFLNRYCSPPFKTVLKANTRHFQKISS